MPLTYTMASQTRNGWHELSQPHDMHYRLPQHSYVAASPAATNPHGSTARSLPFPARWEARSDTQQPSHSTAVNNAFKPSLPSISNLLNIADRERPNASSHAYSRSLSPQQSRQSPRSFQAPEYERSGHMARPSEKRSHPSIAASPQMPTSRHDSGQEGVPPSPSTISTTSSTSGPTYFAGSSINNLDADQQHGANVHFTKRSPRASHPETSPYGSSYASSPNATSPDLFSHHSFNSRTSPASDSYFQQHSRSMPTTNFPLPSPVHVQPMPHDGKLPAMNVWEHHHYISPSTTAGYPTTPDRYQCMTCKKAFSRPSSLKIHSHSHTGEKPFHCAHSGCNKSFSVRSNMKRHERGCHSGGGSLVAPM
nr:c2h2 finger domain transcription factor mtfa [Quercus suber]